MVFGLEEACDFGEGHQVEGEGEGTKADAHPHAIYGFGALQASFSICVHPIILASTLINSGILALL